MEASQRKVNNKLLTFSSVGANYTVNVQSCCSSLTDKAGYMSWETLAAGGTLHLTFIAPYILCCSGLGCTLNGKIGDLNPGFLVEGFLWVALPSLVEKRKNFTATFTFYPSFFLEIAKFHLKPFPSGHSCDLPPIRVTYHYSIFHLTFLIQNLTSVMRVALKQMYREFKYKM